MNRDKSSNDLEEMIRRAIKYLIEGGAVAVACSLIPSNKLTVEEVLMISLTAAAIFAILDMFAPSISYAARNGVGYGIGFNLAGFPGGVPKLM